MNILDIFNDIATLAFIYLIVKQYLIWRSKKEETRDLQIQKRFKQLFVAAGLPSDTKHNFDPDWLKND